jgi:predicted PurR-regulated permease PerM
MERLQISVSWGSLWKILAMVTFVAVLYISRDVFVAALLAIVIAAALDPFVTWLEKRRIPRILGTLGVYIISLFIVALVLYVVLPILLTELNGILENGTDIFGNMIETMGIKSTVLQTAVSALNDFTNNLLGGKTTLVSLLSQLLGGLLLTAIVFVVSFYLTIGRDGVERFMQAVLPYRFHHGVLLVYGRIREKISHWFAGQLFLSVIVGVAVFIGLQLLGIRYSFILAITAALFELVPYVGPIFAGSLAVITAMTQSTTLGVYTLGLFIVIQQFESYLFIPVVNKYTTNLNPVIVILSLLVGGKTLGIVGVLLAVPLAVLFQEMLKHWAHLNVPDEKIEAVIS